jgi:hypothetical protein
MRQLVLPQSQMRYNHVTIQLVSNLGRDKTNPAAVGLNQYSQIMVILLGKTEIFGEYGLEARGLHVLCQIYKLFYNSI